MDNVGGASFCGSAKATPFTDDTEFLPASGQLAQGRAAERPSSHCPNRPHTRGPLLIRPLA